MATITFSFILESLTTTCWWLETVMWMGSPQERGQGEVWERWEKSRRLMSAGKMERISSSLLVLAQSPRLRAEKGTK